jgi:hypothetical protein
MSGWFHSHVGPFLPLMKLKWLKLANEWIGELIWDRAGQLGESGVSSDGKVRKRDVDIRGSKVVAPTCVDWGPFIVDFWESIWLCTDRMLNLWGPVNRHSSMIIVVGRYPTISLEISTGIMYGSPMDSLECGIVWKMCTREGWELDRPYDIVVKDCHTWPVRGHAYVVLVRFIPL